MAWLVILGLALSSSLDNFGVGIAYGIRGIRLSWLSNLIIAVICFLFSYAGIFFGQWLAQILPGALPSVAGGVLLLLIGLQIVLIAPRKKPVAAAVESQPPPSASIKNILEHPEIADADHSGEISFGEAVILGIALSVNALTNGLGGGLLGLSPFAISLASALGSFVTVWAGVALGAKLATVRIGPFTMGEAGTDLGGLILIIIAAAAFL